MRVFLYIHCLWTTLSNLVMKVLPHDPTDNRGQETARIGETAGIHSLEIRPSIKQSHPSKSVDLASASRGALPLLIQFTILNSPLPRRYMLIAAISVRQSVFDIVKNLLHQNLEHLHAAWISTSTDIGGVLVMITTKIAFWRPFSLAPIVLLNVRTTEL